MNHPAGDPGSADDAAGGAAVPERFGCDEVEPRPAPGAAGFDAGPADDGPVPVLSSPPRGPDVPHPFTPAVGSGGAVWPEGPEDPEAEGAEGADGAVHTEDGYDWDDGFTPEPPADGVVCCNCERRTTAPTPVRYVQTVSGPGFVLHACPQCVLSVPHGPLPDDVL